MRVALGTFAREEVEARFGDYTAAGVRAALEHYAGRLVSGPEPPEFPRFRREERGGTIRADLEVSVEPWVRMRLAREAHWVDVPVELLAAHAVFDCLADLDRTADARRMEAQNAALRRSCAGRQRRRASSCV